MVSLRISYSTLGLRALAGFFLLASVACLYSAVTNYWAYLRMRSVPVEVVRSTLIIDAGIYYPGNPVELDYTLRLDLRTTEGSARDIHWEDSPAHAVYPEEALDELARWAPGTRHTIYQLRGDARAIRLPGANAASERSSAFGALFGTFFFGFIGVIVLAALAADDSAFFNRFGLRRFIGPWLAFFVVGVAFLLGTVLFAVHQLPKIFTWPAVTATIAPAPAPAIYTAPNVAITPPARKHLEELPNRRILTFTWNGTTLHGGLGTREGPYDELARVCTPLDETCQFYINPANRWEAELHPGRGAEFFVPLGMFLLFGTVFTGAGLFIRRERF